MPAAVSATVAGVAGAACGRGLDIPVGAGGGAPVGLGSRLCAAGDDRGSGTAIGGRVGVLAPVLAGLAGLACAGLAGVVVVLQTTKNTSNAA